jgi:hypothetical protein
LSKTYGLRTSRIAIITVGLAVLLILTAIGGAPAARAAASKGSSCAHPYTVGWEPNGGSKPSIGLNGIYGDKNAIQLRVRAEVRGFEATFLITSWTPRIPGLKLCEVKIVFEPGKTYVSHHWQRAPLEIHLTGSSHALLDSFTVTAAR